MSEISTYNPEEELAKIARERREIGTAHARERLHKLREQIEINRLFMTKVITALTEALENEDSLEKPLTPHQLWSVVTKERRMLREKNVPTDAVLLRFIRDGVRQLIACRQEMSETLANHDPRRVLAMLQGYELGQLSSDAEYVAEDFESLAGDEMFDFDDEVETGEVKSLDEVVPADLQFRIEPGAVNYNVFITHDQAQRVDLDDSTAGGYAHLGGDTPYSVIFTRDKTSQDATTRLLAHLFESDELDDDPRTLGHETQHQLTNFIDNLGDEFYQDKAATELVAKRKTMQRGKRIATMVLYAPTPIIQSELKMLEEAMSQASWELPTGYGQWKQELLSSNDQSKRPQQSEQFQEMFSLLLSKSEEVEQESQWQGLLKRAKTELLAHLYDAVSMENLQERLMADYFLPKADGESRWLGTPMTDEASMDKLSSWAEKLRRVIAASVEAMTGLSNLGYAKPEIANLLMPYPLDKWSNIARSQESIADKIGAEKSQS
jgi:hypothetical protein